MRYIIDNDLHIHTNLSICSKDEKQTPLALLDYAKEQGLKTICVTDHYWDSAVKCNTAYNWWYEKQNFDHISQNLPLPSSDGIRFLFGCEADLDSDNLIGIPPERYADFDFIIVSTTHFHHMTGEKWTDATNKQLAGHWVERMKVILSSTLPFGKVGVAHPACPLINKKSRADYLETLDLINNDDLYDIFREASKKNLAIEINADMKFEDSEAESVLRMFRIAKECSCKFYLGSDAHSVGGFTNVKKVFDNVIDSLNLTEDDKFII